MNPQLRVGIALRRIASLTSIARVRAHEAERRERNGGVGDDDMNRRVADVATRLEKMADELKAALT